MWLKTSSVVEGSEIPLSQQLLLISMTFDRAALILDLPRSWVPFDLTAIRQLAEQCVPLDERQNPRRFIPGSLIRLPGEKWSTFVSRVRPPQWSWMDYLAAGGPISAQAIANVAEYMFDHQSGHLVPSLGWVSTVSAALATSRICSQSRVLSLTFLAQAGSRSTNPLSLLLLNGSAVYLRIFRMLW